MPSYQLTMNGTPETVDVLDATGVRFRRLPIGDQISA